MRRGQNARQEHYVISTNLFEEQVPKEHSKHRHTGGDGAWQKVRELAPERRREPARILVRRVRKCASDQRTADVRIVSNFTSVNGRKGTYPTIEPSGKIRPKMGKAIDSFEESVMSPSTDCTTDAVPENNPAGDVMSHSARSCGGVTAHQGNERPPPSLMISKGRTRPTTGRDPVHP
jgi:hypothetical protein